VSAGILIGFVIDGPDDEAVIADEETAIEDADEEATTGGSG